MLGDSVMWKVSRKDLLGAVAAGIVALGGMEARATPCQEFTDAINWSKQSTADELFPVEVYLTKHYGYGGTTSSAANDAVHYAFGYAVANPPLPILSGTLDKTFVNSDQGKMVPKANLTIYVEIAYQSGPGGQITYQEKLNGIPIGGMPPTVVKATCVGDFLLTGAHASEVITVGVSRQPGVNTKIPK